MFADTNSEEERKISVAVEDTSGIVFKGNLKIR